MDSLVVSNIRQRPVRALVSVAGVALGVCLVMLFTGLSRGMSNDLQRRSSNLSAEIIFARRGGSGLVETTATLSTKYAEELLKVEGVEAALPAIRYASQAGRGFGFEQIEGVNWEPFAHMNGLQLVEGSAPREHDAARAERGEPDEVVIDVTKARNNKVGVGGTVNLFGNIPYRVAGIYAPEAGPRVKMPLAAMQYRLSAPPNRCTWIYLKVKEGYTEEDVAARIGEVFKEDEDVKIQFTRDVFTNVEKSIPFLGVFLRTLVVLSAVVSALVVMLAMYTTITERTREIGILKALGASRGYIVAEIETEALVISLLGLAVGFVVSFVAGYLIQRAYNLSFEYGWTWALTAALIGLGGGLLGALYPAVKAANLDPVNALAYE